MNDERQDTKAKVDQLKIPLDPIHGGMRMAVFGTFFGAGVTGFAASLLLIPNPGVLPFIVGAVAAAGASNGVERALKDRWPSGRELIADGERIALTRDSKIEAVIDPTQQVNVMTWKFAVRKDGPRAKKGWTLLSIGLKQDDNYLVFYTTASPDDMDEMPIASAFTKLEKKKSDAKSSLSSSSGMRQAGEQKRLHDAEIARQLIGGDMLLEDFVGTIEFFQTHYPHWMITD